MALRKLPAAEFEVLRFLLAVLDRDLERRAHELTEERRIVDLGAIHSRDRRDEILARRQTRDLVLAVTRGTRGLHATRPQRPVRLVRREHDDRKIRRDAAGAVD